jgi:hypothetical protein
MSQENQPPSEAITLADWNDTKLILQELEQLFARDDDIKDILEIKLLERNYHALIQQNVKDAKEIIKGILAFSIVSSLI